MCPHMDAHMCLNTSVLMHACVPHTYGYTHIHAQHTTTRYTHIHHELFHTHMARGQDKVLRLDCVGV
jgi:hypothetical protein